MAFIITRISKGAYAVDPDNLTLTEKARRLSAAELDVNLGNINTELMAATTNVASQGTAISANTTAVSAKEPKKITKTLATSGSIAITMDVNFRADIVQTGNIDFASASSGHVENTDAIIILDGNNSNTLTLPAAWINSGGNSLDNTKRNRIRLSYSKSEFEYSIVKSIIPIIDITPPVAASIVVSSATPSVARINFNKAINTSISTAISAFSISGKTISGIAIGTNYIDLTVTAVFVSGASHTCSYTQPTANQVQDLSVNLLVSFSANTITNNVAVAGISTKSITITAANQVPKTSVSPTNLAFGSLGTDTAVSVEFYLKWVPNGSNQTVMYLGLNNTAVGAGLLVQILNTGEMYFQFFDSSGNQIYRFTSPLTNGAVNHIELTYSGSKVVSGIKVYINGFLATTTSGSSGTYAGQSAFNSNTRFNLFSGVFAGENVATSIGLDEFRWWNAELTASQVTTCYGGGSSNDATLFAFASNLQANWRFENNLNDSGANGYNLTSTVAPSYPANLA